MRPPKNEAPPGGAGDASGETKARCTNPSPCYCKNQATPTRALLNKLLRDPRIGYKFGINGFCGELVVIAEPGSRDYGYPTERTYTRLAMALERLGGLKPVPMRLLKEMVDYVAGECEVSL